MSNKAAISLATGLEDAERVTVALLVAVAAAEAGRPTLMFLTKEAVRLATDGVAVGTACDGCPDIPSLMARLAAAGGTLLVCPICFNAKEASTTRDPRRQRLARRHRAAVGVDRSRGRQLLQLLTKPVSRSRASTWPRTPTPFGSTPPAVFPRSPPSSRSGPSSTRRQVRRADACRSPARHLSAALGRPRNHPTPSTTTTSRTRSPASMRSCPTSWSFFDAVCHSTATRAAAATTSRRMSRTASASRRAAAHAGQRRPPWPARGRHRSAVSRWARAGRRPPGRRGCRRRPRSGLVRLRPRLLLPTRKLTSTHSRTRTPQRLEQADGRLRFLQGGDGGGERRGRVGDRPGERVRTSLASAATDWRPTTSLPFRRSSSSAGRARCRRRGAAECACARLAHWTACATGSGSSATTVASDASSAGQEVGADPVGDQGGGKREGPGERAVAFHASSSAVSWSSGRSHAAASSSC